MKTTIFYSWQSDLPNDHGKELIRQALEEAIARLVSDTSLVVRPELDHDTQGIPGSPPMVAAILAKIDQCSVFVADVSLTFARDVEGPARRSPNPNVLLELGYALKRLGHERVLLVLNNATGRIEDLPFDLRGNRAISFTVDQLPQLVSDFQRDLKLIFSTVGLPRDVSSPVSIYFERENLQITPDQHRYRLRVRVKNEGEKILADWSVESTFPQAVLEANKTYPNLRGASTPGLVVMSQVEANHSGPLYPDQEKEVLVIDYIMNNELHAKAAKLFALDVTVGFYVGADRVGKRSIPFRDLQEF